MTKKEAIEGSIKKWKAILNNYYSLDMVTKKCDLCNKYMDRDCVIACIRCPLYKAGNGCLERGSVFDKLSRKILYPQGTSNFVEIITLNGLFTYIDISTYKREHLREISKINKRDYNYIRRNCKKMLANLEALSDEN